MAAAAIATLSSLSSLPCKKRLRQHGANNAQQFISNSRSSHGHHSLTLSPSPRVPRPRAAARRVTVAAQAGSGYTVAILGAAGEVGQPLALLAKMSPLISHLNLYDTSADVEGVAADLSHCNTPAQVTGFTGKDSLPACLSGAHVVVIAAGTFCNANDDDDVQFGANAGVVSELAAAVAEHAPASALVHVLTAPVSATVPVVAEVLKRKGHGAYEYEYDPRRLLGVTTLDVVRANSLVAARKALPLADVDVPVVGGSGGGTGLPLLSKARPRAAAFTEGEAEELTAVIRAAGDQVAEAKQAGGGGGDGGSGSGSSDTPTMSLSMAYAAARFLEATLRGLEGHDDVYECAYVQSQELVPELPFFACRVKLGRGGVDEVVGSELRGITEYEARELEELKPKLRASIDKGVAFVQQQQEAALN